MNSLSRAKHFIAKKASKLALAVVPLAALAVATPAKANVIFDVGSNCGAFFTGGSGSCFTGSPSASGGNSSAGWVQMFGTGFTADGNSGGFFASGGANGALLAGSVPVSWDFSVTSGSGAFFYDVFFDLFFSGGSVGFDSSNVASAPTEITGSGSIILPSGGVGIIGYDIGLNTNAANSSFGYTLTVPGGSTLDLNPASGVPEPATLLFTAVGGGMLLMLRRRKKPE